MHKIHFCLSTFDLLPLFFTAMDFQNEIEILANLAFSLKKTKDLGEKQELLLNLSRVATAVSSGELAPFLPHEHDLSAKIALYGVVAIGQHTTLFAYPHRNIPKEKVKSLLTTLVSIERFYESIGGIVGYHVQVLKFLAKRAEAGSPSVIFKQAEGIDLASPSDEVNKSILTGIRALDEMGEMYPIGGLGSRLNLMSKTFEPLPAACLPFGGKTLLEGLIRDVQAREFLYYRLFNRQVTVPIAMMTSLEKRNAVRVESMCEKKGWFGRPKESFFLFSQISVPVVTQEGAWSMTAPLKLNLQPGGHGALWKAAEEKGVFVWFQGQEKKHLLIRQINNPIAGLDFGLMALIGTGIREQKTFGFASCQRLTQTAEGVLVLVEEKGSKRLSNIEYTDFKQYGIEDLPAKNGYSLYPANTNILYANLERILPIIKKNPLPGLMLNMKNKEPFLCPSGEIKATLGGRLESMMQNISDALIAKENEPLPTFLTYNERKKTISAAKKSFESGKTLLETPEGAFYDLLYNAYELLKQWCSASIGPFSTHEEYLEQGPSLLFLYHPALGPLYDLIAQKIKRPIFAWGSELQLEIADICLEDVQLEGSMRIFAKNTLGHNSQGIIRYSHKTGKCILKNVCVKNKGINRKATSHYWKNQIKRYESLTIILQGHSEFYAENVVFAGHQTIVVPDGERWVASQDNQGNISYRIEKPSWQWEYLEENNRVLVTHLTQKIIHEEKK